ncbi:MAG: hypothetical protein EOP06_09460 [Proteobacteria bacterium]|nr:MAG: hypothetical protein EOP06_09460 [Pseudomonadota bacterium]
MTGDVTTTTTGTPPTTTGDQTTTTTGTPPGTTGDVTTTTTGDQSTTTTGTPPATTTTGETATTTTTGETTGETATTTSGETTGDTTGGDEPGEDNPPSEEVVETPAPAKQERELKSKLEPFFYIDFDWGSWIVNLTPHEANKKAPSYVKNDFNPKNDTLVYGDYKDGFQKTTFSNIEGGLGAKVSFWYANATGIMAQWWAYVGAMPVIGRETESVRYAKTLEEASKLEGYKKVPSEATELNAWSQGDHMTYVSKGGVMFAASMGFGIFNVGSAALAQGTWETYIEKVEADTVYVKMTKGDLSNYSAFTGATLVNLSVSKFNNSDDGFSFLFNLKTEVGRKAYEDMIRGNVLASAIISTSVPENMVEVPPVLKVETFKTLTTGKMVSRMFGLPIIWNTSYSKGNIQSFTTSEFHLDNSRAEVNYGIFSREKNYRLWNKHSETDYMFYGARYTVTNNSDNSKMQGMFGRYSYAYKNEMSDSNKLRKAIQKLVKITGIDDLMVNIPTMKLDYTGLDFDTTLSEENTQRLMDFAKRKGEDYFLKMGDKYVINYAQNNGDVYTYCIEGGIET